MSSRGNEEMEEYIDRTYSSVNCWKSEDGLVISLNSLVRPDKDIVRSAAVEGMVIRWIIL